jgi:hypothetical protein
MSRLALPIGLLTGAVLVIAACTTAAPVRPQAAGTADVTPAAAPTAAPEAKDGILPPTAPPSSLTYSDWRTDFGRRTVEWDEIASGGPPKDGIPAVDDPQFEPVETAAGWLSERDPVILFEHGGEARAYPLAILIWHEIANDVVGGKPVSVTFCPLCNASIVFDREFEGQVLDFGTTGLLRNSDLVMYDRQTETWWQQFTGQGIVGEHAGKQLAFLPSQVVSFGDFAAEFPAGQVLARPTAPRSYGNNPYAGYDSTAGRPFLYSGKLDDRLPSTARVLGLELEGEIKAYPFAALQEAGAVNDEIAGAPIVVFHKAGTASALDERIIAEGRDVGSAAAYSRVAGDQTLTFQPNGDGAYTDAETGSTWTIFGEAVAGPLAGTELVQLLAFDHFWFAWSAFFPESGLYEAS